MRPGGRVAAAVGGVGGGAMWGDDMLVLPDGSAASRRMRACRCGGEDRVVVRGPRGYAIWCRRCYRAGPGERVVGRVDPAGRPGATRG